MATECYANLGSDSNRNSSSTLLVARSPRMPAGSDERRLSARRRPCNSRERRIA